MTSALRVLAARLEAVAGWVDGELAAGQPERWVAAQAAIAAREIAATARADAELAHFSPDAGPRITRAD